MYNINKGSTKAEITKALKEEGFDAPDGATRDELLNLLSSLTGTDYSKFSSSAKAEKAEESTSAESKKKYTIVIPSGETKVSQGDVFVGYNGTGYQLKRDVEIEVPEGVLIALRAARQKIGIQKEDGSLEYRTVYAYPFNVVNVA